MTDTTLWERYKDDPRWAGSIAHLRDYMAGPLTTKERGFYNRLLASAEAASE